MWLKVIFLVVTVVNVKAVDNIIDNNGRVLQVPSSSSNEGARYFEIQRGPNGEMTGLVEVQQGQQIFLPIINGGLEKEIANPLPANIETTVIRLPEEQPQPAPTVLVEKNNDKKDDVVLVEIDNKPPPQNQIKEDIIIEEAEPAKLTAPSPPRNIFVINERQTEPEPKPDPRPVIVSRISEPDPRPIIQPTIIAPPSKPQPVPDQVVVIPSRQPKPAANQVVILPSAKPEPKPVVNYIFKTPVQQEPAPRPIVNVRNNQLSDYECRRANGYFALQNQCNRFVECKELKAYYYECPDGMNFNRNAVWPNFPCGNSLEIRCEVNVFERSPVFTRECPSLYGLYALPDNECSNYIACQEGIATLMTCPKGLVFNPILQACDWLENVPSCRPQVFSGVTCPAFQEGDVDFVSKYRYGQSCTEYIACHRGAPRLLHCDAGLAFDDQLQSCVAADRVHSCSSMLLL